MLGICYGHQLLAYSLGGEVGSNLRGPEFGTVEVAVHEPAAKDPLFAHLPRKFRAHASHAQCVLKLPAGATCLASSERDPHQAFVVGPRVWGVQFHPEFDVEAAAIYIRGFSRQLRRSGVDPLELLQSVTETPVAESLLARFGRIANGWGR
jgi:GMP synthase (glutamine-hydrolysing)